MECAQCIIILRLVQLTMTCSGMLVMSMMSIKKMIVILKGVTIEG